MWNTLLNGILKKQLKLRLNNTKNKKVKKEYDFSNGERGKFYRPNLKLNLPIYLDEESFTFVNKIAKSKKQEVSFVVNQLIHFDMHIADTIN